MSNEAGSSADKDLLARLNALKKTHIDLDDKQYRIPVSTKIQPAIDPSPVRALHGDLVSRFKSLNDTQSQDKDGETDMIDGDGALAEEDSKTIEDLLAELGGEGAWNIEKDEATQIDDLLRSANTALKDSKPDDENDTDHDYKAGNSYIHDLPSLDVQVTKPEPEPEDDELSDEEPRKSKKEVEADIDREADDFIAKLRDELKNAPPDPDPESEEEQHDQFNETNATSNLPSAPAFDLPTIPTANPKPDTSQADNDLASRFASLGLPSAPSTTLPSAPSNKPGAKPTTSTRYGASSKHTGHTDEEIDSWCIICLEDATLRCIGCDGDLYCSKCWIEGHRGPDAGYEERKHKAVEYNKGVKKERRRVAA